MKGLFNSEELEADNVKDKDKKLAFLQKLVDFLSVVHERTIPVRIMSIVAGKEAEKTNEMLFLLAEAVNKKVWSNNLWSFRSTTKNMLPEFSKEVKSMMLNQVLLESKYQKLSIQKKSLVWSQSSWIIEQRWLKVAGKTSQMGKK